MIALATQDGAQRRRANVFRGTKRGSLTDEAATTFDQPKLPPQTEGEDA